MGCNNNCNCGCGNNGRGFFFDGCETFWIVVIIAIVIIWVHYYGSGHGGCCNGCFGNNMPDCGNNCCC